MFQEYNINLIPLKTMSTYYTKILIKNYNEYFQMGYFCSDEQQVKDKLVNGNLADGLLIDFKKYMVKKEIKTWNAHLKRALN